MTPAVGTDAPPLADPPPVVGGRFAPIMGLRRNAVDYAESMWRRHGDLVHMVVGPPGSSRDVWWVHHPDGAARVLSGSSWRAYSKQDQVHDEIARWLGPGLLTAEGEDWTRQKRFLQPLFTKAAVDGYADLMVAEIETVVGEWDTADTPTVDLGLQMQRLTLRVVLAALFGDAADDVLPHVRHSFPAVSDTILRRGLGAVRLPAGIPTRRVRRGRAARDELFGVCDAIVTARREGRTTGETDLLSLLLAARDGDERLGDEEVRSQVLLFMMAGHETTAIALTFALHLLGRHQDVQDAVRAEVREVLGDRLPDRRHRRRAAADDGGAEGGHAALPLGADHGPADRAGGRADGPPGAGRRQRRRRAVDHPPPPRLLGRPARASTRPASPAPARGPNPRTATRGCRSAAARAPASASTSRWSRPCWPWRWSCAGTGSPRWPTATSCR